MEGAASHAAWGRGACVLDPASVPTPLRLSLLAAGYPFTAVPIARITRVAHATQPLRTLTFRPSFRLQRFPQLAVASTGADTVLIAPLDQEALMAALRARNPAIAMPEGVRTSRAPETIPLNEGGL